MSGRRHDAVDPRMAQDPQDPRQELVAVRHRHGIVLDLEARAPGMVRGQDDQLAVGRRDTPPRAPVRLAVREPRLADADVGDRLVGLARQVGARIESRGHRRLLRPLASAEGPGRHGPGRRSPLAGVYRAQDRRNPPVPQGTIREPLRARSVGLPAGANASTTKPATSGNLCSSVRWSVPTEPRPRTVRYARGGQLADMPPRRCTEVGPTSARCAEARPRRRGCGGHGVRARAATRASWPRQPARRPGPYGGPPHGTPSRAASASSVTSIQPG